MDEQLGLRERKRLRTHKAISDAAITLFMERGYDNVSITDVAAAAEVSRRTLFAYFASKDELVLHRFADHEDEPARVVRGRAENESPLDALHRQYRQALTDRDPITGLCDHPEVVAFYQLILNTPALRSALVNFTIRSEQALQAALQESAPDEDPSIARLAAAQILAIRQTLSRVNQERIAAGETADAVAPDALTAAGNAHTMLTTGLARYR